MDSYQSFPKYVDHMLQELGGKRVHPRGAANADGVWEEAWEEWEATIWSSVVPQEILKDLDTSALLAYNLKVQCSSDSVNDR